MDKSSGDRVVLTEVPISKAVRRLAKNGQRQNLVFGWANVPYPVEKADHSGTQPEGSLERELEEISGALGEQRPNPDKDGGQFVLVTFEDSVIVERWSPDTGNVLLRFPMVRSDDGTLTFGEPTEVERAFVTKAMAESVDTEALFTQLLTTRGLVAKRRPKMDLQGDRVPIEELERAAYEFVLTSRAGTVEHEGPQVAELAESFVVTDEKLELMGFDVDARAKVNKGWWLAFQVDDPTMDMVEAGELTAFSIEGRATRVVE